jgi:multicomponent Na+:H+ antiporter subunit D
MRHLRPTGMVFLFGAAGMAGLPPFGTFWGETLIGGSAHNLRFHWVEWVFFISAATTAGALFRFCGHVFLRWGPPVEEFADRTHKIEEKRDTEGGHWRTPAAMYFPAALLIFLGALIGLAPRLTGAAKAAAIHIQDRAGYAQRVLDLLTPYPPTVYDQPATGGDIGRALATVCAALLLATVALTSGRTRRALRHFRPLRLFIAGVRHLHSGLIPDYVAWLVFGVAAFTSATVLMMR